MMEMRRPQKPSANPPACPLCAKGAGRPFAMKIAQGCRTVAYGCPICNHVWWGAAVAHHEAAKAGVKT
jgi:hypothetical protein